MHLRRYNPSPFYALFSLVALFSLPSIQATIKYAGVCVSSGEFSVYAPGSPGTGLPGRFGVDYHFINETNYGLGATFNETHWGFYQQAVQYITARNAYVILDPHNFMRYNDPSNQPTSGSIIGDTSDAKAAMTAQFAAFWAELSKRFLYNPYVIFGLVNEPHDMSTALVLANNQAAIDAIRAGKARQLILAPGNGYTGGHAWTTSSQGDSPSSQYLGMLTDPLDNTAIEYFDATFAGSGSACVNSFASTMDPLTQWLKANNMKALIAEFGGSDTETCEDMIRSAVDYVAANPEYIGIAAWAAGPLWGKNSPCCNDLTAENGSLEPGSKASDGGPSFYDSLWVPVYLPKYKQYFGTLQRFGYAGVN